MEGKKTANKPLAAMAGKHKRLCLTKFGPEHKKFPNPKTCIGLLIFLSQFRKTSRSVYF